MPEKFKLSSLNSFKIFCNLISIFLLLCYEAIRDNRYSLIILLIILLFQCCSALAMTQTYREQSFCMQSVLVAIHSQTVIFESAASYPVCTIGNSSWGSNLSIRHMLESAATVHPRCASSSQRTLAHHSRPRLSREVPGISHFLLDP